MRAKLKACCAGPIIVLARGGLEGESRGRKLMQEYRSSSKDNIVEKKRIKRLHAPVCSDISATSVPTTCISRALLSPSRYFDATRVPGERTLWQTGFSQSFNVTLRSDTKTKQ